MEEFVSECFSCRFRDLDATEFPCSKCNEFSGVMWEPRTLWRRFLSWLGSSSWAGWGSSYEEVL